jgi:hypothetical protein
MASLSKISEYSLRFTLGILATGSLTQFTLTLININMAGYKIIILQIIFFICFWMLNKFNNLYPQNLPSKRTLLINYFLILLFSVAALRILFLHRNYDTDLLGTSNLLLNIFSNNVYFGIVSPEFRDFAFHSFEVDISTFSNSSLFYPAGSLFSIYFFFTLIDTFHFFSLLNMQLLFMAFLVLNLFVLLYFYLLSKHQSFSNILFLIILSFNFFPLYYISAGDIALLSSSVYVILLLLFKSEQLHKSYYFLLHLIITFYLHPLGVILLLVGYMLFEVSRLKDILKIIVLTLSFGTIIAIALKEVFLVNLENYFYASNDYFEVSPSGSPSVNNSSESDKDISQSFISYSSRLMYVISDNYFQNPYFYFNLIPLIIITIGFILYYQKFKFYLIILVIIYTSIHSDLIPTELVTIFNTINFGDKYRLDSLRFLTWVSLIILIAKHPKAPRVYSSPVLLILLIIIFVFNFYNTLTISSGRLYFVDNNSYCKSLTTSTLYNSTILLVDGVYQKCYLANK